MIRDINEVNFNYHGLVRRSGATTDMLTSALIYASSNLDRNVMCLFGSYQMKTYSEELLPKGRLPINFYMLDIHGNCDFLRGKRVYLRSIFIDGSVRAEDFGLIDNFTI